MPENLDSCEVFQGGVFDDEMHHTPQFVPNMQELNRLNPFVVSKSRFSERRHMNLLRVSGFEGLDGPLLLGRSLFHIRLVGDRFLSFK